MANEEAHVAEKKMLLTDLLKVNLPAHSKL